MAKGRSSHFFRHGLFGSYTDYRYAASTVRQKKHERVFRGDKRRHVINMVMNVLRDWRQSPFEFEGAARAGLRSGLCLQGYNWRQADDAAAEIVAEALLLLGAVRPTWEQGQREYVEPRENCAWCGGPRDPFQRSARFCSPDCAKSAALTRGYEGKARDDRARALMLALARRTKNQKRTCLHCHASFYPESNSSSMKFCSHTCAYQHRHTTAARVFDCRCLICDTPFKAKLAGAMYCSRACAATAHRRRRGIGPTEVLTRICEACGSTFETTSKTALCCSNNCKVFHQSVRNGKAKWVTARVLDYLFRQQGLRITCEKMAA